MAEGGNLPNEIENEDDSLNVGSGMGRKIQASEALSEEIQEKIRQAFLVFDHENNNTVDAREIGTIIRSLGYCPSEAELQEALRDMEDPQQMGFIQFDRFYPVMSKIIVQRKYQLNTPEELLKAFQVMDSERKGHLEIDEIKQYFTQHGEPFASDEIEELLNAAVTQSTMKIQYRVFLHSLIIDDDQQVKWILFS